MSERAKMDAEQPSVEPPLDDQRFLQQFEDRSLPLAGWHHRQHIKVAYLYLRKYELAEAGQHVADGIRAYNAAHQIADTPTSGYHETMTQAWLRLVDFVLRQYGPAESADDFFDAHPELWQSKTLRLFYSREQFMSAEAKTRFVEPDLAPLPVSKSRKITMPRLYRVILPVSDIETATSFYHDLLGQPGRRVSLGRHYFDCGGTILACFDPRADGDDFDACPNADHIYFSVPDVDAVFERALRLGCKRIDQAVQTQPWGERCFYATDPFGNPFCVVDEQTVFTGKNSR
jgi:predicted enzyme related to lactoylglutathione lyase